MADDANPYAKFAAPTSGNPYEKFRTDLPDNFAPTAKTTVQSTADKYAGWDQFSAPPPAAPLQNEPGKTYGTILPFSRDDATGKVQLAVPEMLRAPIRGMVEGGQEIRGQRPVDDPAARGDIIAAATALGGVRAGPGEPKPGPVEAPKSPVKTGAVEAREAGYVLPPKSASKSPGIVAQALAGWGGKIKTRQDAMERNQEVTNSLATKALGLPPEAILTPKVFTNIIQKAGQSYRDVINAVPTVNAGLDPDFRTAVADLGGQNSQAAKAFPKIMGNTGIQDMVGELSAAGEHPTAAWIELVKQLRFDGTANLKTIGDPSKHALGLAQREAANAIDDMLDRQISAAGQPGVVDTYRAARKLIAKAYDVQGATNASGDVSAIGLMRLADKGRPLTDELRTIANAASSFPKSMGMPADFGDSEAWSALDFFGSLAAAGHGDPGVVGTILARPLARKAVLSPGMQNRIVNPMTPNWPAPFLLPDQRNDTAQALGVQP